MLFQRNIYQDKIYKSIFHIPWNVLEWISRIHCGIYHEKDLNMKHRFIIHLILFHIRSWIEHQQRRYNAWMKKRINNTNKIKIYMIY